MLQLIGWSCRLSCQTYSWITKCLLQAMTTKFEGFTGLMRIAIFDNRDSARKLPGPCHGTTYCDFEFATLLIRHVSTDRLLVRFDELPTIMLYICS